MDPCSITLSLQMPPTCLIAFVKSGEAVQTIHISGLRYGKETEEIVKELFQPDVLSYVANKNTGFNQAFAYYLIPDECEKKLTLNKEKWPHDDNWTINCRRSKIEMDLHKVQPNKALTNSPNY